MFQISPESLKEILNVENILIEEINLEIENVITQLEDLIQLSQEHPELLRDNSEQLQRIDREIVSSLENVKEYNNELYQSSLIQKSIFKLRSLLIGSGTGIVAGAVAGSFFPVIGYIGGCCLGLVGGAVSGYLISFAVTK